MDDSILPIDLCVSADSHDALLEGFGLVQRNSGRRLGPRMLNAYM